MIDNDYWCDDNMILNLLILLTDFNQFKGNQFYLKSQLLTG